MKELGNIDKFVARRRNELMKSRAEDMATMIELLERAKRAPNKELYDICMEAVKTFGESAKHTKEILERIERDGLTPAELSVERMMDAVDRHARGEWTQEELDRFADWKLKKLEAEGKLYVRN